MSSVADNRVAIVAEVTPGTQVATPSFLTVPTNPGDGMNWQHQTAESPVLLPNRASQGTRRTAYSSAGSIKGVLQYSPYTDLLLQSALAGTFSTNTLVAGGVDSYVSLEKTMSQGTLNMYKRFTGVGCQKLDLKASVTGMCEVTYDLIGFGQHTFVSGTGTTNQITGATYTSPTVTPFAGPDIGIVKIAGATAANALSIAFSVSTEKTVQNVFGSLFGLGIASGKRTASIEMSFYRQDITFETAYANTDATVDVYFEITPNGAGSGGGYRFELLKANVSAPDDQMDSNSNVVKLTFTAQDNGGAGDVKVTKLP